MRFGICLPTGQACGDPRFLVELAERAEAAGWDGVFLEDYVCYQGDPAAPTCDTWIALAAMAARTERVTLGTEVTPLTRRRPWNVAREAAAVDQLSGGRPQPVQRPRVPIWIGGGYPNPRPTRRAARWDGCCLYKETHGGPWENLTPDDVRALRELAGDRSFTIVLGGAGRTDDWEAERRHIGSVAAAGADWWIEWVPPADPGTMRHAADRGPLHIE